MKRKIIAALAAAAVAAGVHAREASDILVFINPGHGGHGSDDRNVVIEPFSQGDPEGYWESNSNLVKGLWLRDMLEAKGYRVMMSRTTNTEDDDLPLSTISRMANEAGADLFFSIHSNATGTATRSNFPLMLYRGWDSGADNPEDRVIAEILNRHLLENQATYWTSSSMNVRGDWSFYHWGYKVGLGVLRGLTVTGMLSEGSFHDYIPETYRLMNEDFCRLEAWHFRRAVDEYFGQSGETVGQVAGLVRDSRLPRPGDYIIHGDDRLATVQNALVELLDEAGVKVAEYTTSSTLVNGFYAFRDVAPGKYHLRVTAPTHYSEECDIEVKADSITYTNISMMRVRDTPPTVTSYAPVWKQGDEPVLCNTPLTMSFSWDMDIASTEKAFSITPAVNGKFTWSDLNYTLTFTPDAPYDTNTLYTVRLSADAEHAGGMKMTEPFEFSFMTTDRNFMEVTRAFPVDGSEVYYSGSWVELHLDHHPDGSALTSQISCVDSKGNVVPFNRTGKKVSTSRSRYGFLRLPFGKDLTPGETYTVTFDGSICDRDGITIAHPITATFKAVDIVPDRQGTRQPACDASLYTLDTDQSVSVIKATVKADTKITVSDSSAVSLSYEFEGNSGGQAVWTISNTENVTLGGEELTFAVYGDLSGNTLSLQLDTPSGVEMFPLATLDFAGWRKFKLVYDGDAGNATIAAVVISQNDATDSSVGTVCLSDLYVKPALGVGDVVGDNATVSVYPNPASQYIIANADSLIDSVELVSTSGAVVARATGNILNVESVPSGLYLCRVQAGATVSVRKIIVEH